MQIRTVLSIAAASLVIASCSSGGSNAGTSATTTEPEATTTLAQKPVTFEKDTCPTPVPDSKISVECGWLHVPENRLVANSPTIKLAVAWMHSAAAKPGAPVVDLGGGPGFPSVKNLDSFVKSPILDNHDFIVWDQRGIGYSTPNLDCPEYGKAVFAMLDTVDPPATEGQRVDQAITECRKRLVGEGIDLNGFNTTQNAADLADLRVALKIPEWNLHAGSYGTALALEELRTHPQGLRSVLLDSVVSPDATIGALERAKSAKRSIDLLVATCNEQPSCHDTYGDLDALIAKAAKSLDEDPYETVVTDPDTGEEHRMHVTGADLYGGLFQAMYNPSLIAAVPAAMQQIADGKRAIIGTLAAQAIPLATGSSTGMMLSVDCADRQRIMQPDKLEPYMKTHPEVGTVVYLSAAENECRNWDVESAPKVFNAMPTKTKVPVIVAAGKFDPVTPPAGSKRVAKALGAPYLFFPDAGHGAIGVSECSKDIWFAFMDNPAKKLDTSCMKKLATIKLG